MSGSSVSGIGAVLFGAVFALLAEKNSRTATILMEIQASATLNVGKPPTSMKSVTSPKRRRSSRPPMAPPSCIPRATRMNPWSIGGIEGVEEDRREAEEAGDDEEDGLALEDAEGRAAVRNMMMRMKPKIDSSGHCS